MAGLNLSPEVENSARSALHEIEQEASASRPQEGRIRAALERFGAYLTQAGQPAVTAAFLTLAKHLGIANTR